MAKGKKKTKADGRVRKSLQRRAELIAEIDNHIERVFRHLERELQAYFSQINYINKSPIARLHDAVEAYKYPKAGILTRTQRKPITEIFKRYFKWMKVRDCDVFMVSEFDEFVPRRIAISFNAQSLKDKIYQKFGVRLSAFGKKFDDDLVVHVSEDWPFTQRGNLKSKFGRHLQVQMPLSDRLDVGDLEDLAALVKEHFEDAWTLASMQPT